MGYKQWITKARIVTILLCALGTTVKQAAAGPVSIEETGKLQQIGGDFVKPGLLGVLYGVKFLSDVNELGADNICAQFIKNTSYVCPTQQGESGQVVQHGFDFSSPMRIGTEVDFTEHGSEAISDRVQAWIDVNGLNAVTWSSDGDPGTPPPPPPPATEPSSMILLGTGLLAWAGRSACAAIAACKGTHQV